MAKLSSRQDLSEYCLRALGAPVINIEIDVTQINDRIDDAIDFFTERHYSGVDSSYFAQMLSYDDLKNNSVTIDDDIRAVTEVMTSTKDSIEIFDSVEFNMMDEFNRQQAQGTGLDMQSYYITKQHLSMMSNILTARKQFTHNEITNLFIPNGWSLQDIGYINRLKDTTNIEESTWVKTNSTTDSKSVNLPNGNAGAHKVIASDAVSVFGIEQLIDLKQYHTKSAFTSVITLKSNEYTGSVVVSILDEDLNTITTKIITLKPFFEETVVKFTVKTNHRSHITFKIESSVPATNPLDSFVVHNIKLFSNPYLILHGYKAVSEDFVDLFNDMFIKKYSTALMKLQWGNNIGKFGNMQMPGGVTMSGDRIIQEAQQAIDKLEEEFTSRYEIPLDIYIA